jgi:hypothetical protein
MRINLRSRHCAHEILQQIRKSKEPAKNNFWRAAKNDLLEARQPLSALPSSTDLTEGQSDSRRCLRHPKARAPTGEGG